MRLLLATSNLGKVLELRHLFASHHLETVTPLELGLKLKVVESGTSYQENARLKAISFARASGLVTVADDSGLEVDALGGEPGIMSARYAGEDADDSARIAKLLSNLRNVPWEKRTARFCCVIAVASPDGEIGFTEGMCYGMIAFEPRGNDGFGYDPVFYLPEYGKTMAELPLDLKNRVSHRGKAALAALPIVGAMLKRAGENAGPV